MPTREKVQVKSFDGLYDEEITYQRFHINERDPLCGWLTRHKWVNGSLGWTKATDTGHYSIEVVENGRNRGPDGCVRLCEKCKLIDCFHWWWNETEYELAYDAYYAETMTVATCRRCGLRVLLFTGGRSSPSERSFTLIAEVMEELYPNPEPDPSEGVILSPPQYVAPICGYTGSTCMPNSYGTTMPYGNRGSKFYVELPVLVSRIIDKQGEEAAKEYVRQCANNGVQCSNNALREV